MYEGRMAKSPRTPSLKRAQARYQRDQREAGRAVQINIELKTDEDLTRWERLAARYPDLSKSGIGRLALTELDGRSNAPPPKRKG